MCGVFGRVGEQWASMGSVIEGAAAGDEAGSSVAVSEYGYLLVVASRGSDSGRGSLVLYVWTSGGWAQRGGVVAGALAGLQFGTYVALSGDGTVVAGISGRLSGVGCLAFDLTAELGGVGDGVCQAAFDDDSAAYLPGAGLCSGMGITDVCVACEGGEYPIGPTRACGVCVAGEYRHPTSFACRPCPADSAECQAVFGSSAWSLDSSLMCGGLVSGCVVTPRCSPGYYGGASNGGACDLCTGHVVGIVQRGAPVPADEIAAADEVARPSSVAVSGSGVVLAVGFYGCDSRRRGVRRSCSCVLVEWGSVGAKGQ